MLNGFPVAWCSTKQSVTAQSTTEAEYVSACAAARELSWWKIVLAALDLPQGAVLLHEDNSGAIKWAEGQGHHKVKKHIGVRYHFVRDMVEAKELVMVPIASVDQTADIFTKGLGQVSFRPLREKLLRPLHSD